ncbi:hypothetical protein LCGC14_0344320 [marine sediment metagenome]|uniref:Uncharacterized protein n=1 Tax=marine sediment metagenome TaxID=412755 RepID=A0A0F9VZX0_9ZZZZ
MSDIAWIFHDANGNSVVKPTYEVVAALLKVMDLRVVLVDGEVVVVTRQSKFNEEVSGDYDFKP